MCGIIGYVGKNNSTPYIIDGLKKLEYRGYDSAGISILQDDKIVTVRAVGKVAELEKAALIINPQGTTGIGHTRWATHGRPSEENSHPHTDCSGELVVVHNGIIENYLTLREKLQKLGHKFKSETDTEVIAHLIEENLKHTRAANNEEKLIKAIQKTNAEIAGAFAIGVLWARTPGMLVCVKTQSPLVVGLGNNDITPDAIGPQTAAKVLATRHLRDETDIGGEHFLTSLRPVSSCAGGVMGQTGIETAEIVRAISEELRPSAIIAVDALACTDISRLGTTIQLTDTGISPGSDVSNRRQELSEKLFNIPVIAVGVPTVVDMHTIVRSLTGKKINGELPNMMVTPRDIDRLTERASQLLAFGINLALQPTLTFEDVRGLF